METRITFQTQNLQEMTDVCIKQKINVKHWPFSYCVKMSLHQNVPVHHFNLRDKQCCQASQWFLQPINHTCLVFWAYSYIHGITTGHKMRFAGKGENSSIWNCVVKFLLPAMSLIAVAYLPSQSANIFLQSTLKTQKIHLPSHQMPGSEVKNWLLVCPLHKYVPYLFKKYILKLVNACFKCRSLFKIQAINQEIIT